MDTDKLKDEARGLKDKANGIQNETFKTQSKLDAFERELQMGKQQLEEWAQVKQQKDDDAFALEKYVSMISLFYSSCNRISLTVG